MKKIIIIFVLLYLIFILYSYYIISRKYRNCKINNDYFTKSEYYKENNLTFTNLSYTNDTITLVSAYYMVKSKRNSFYYINKLYNLFQLNRSIVFFTEKAFMKVAKDLRPKNLYNKTVFIELDLEDFFSYKFFGKKFENAYKSIKPFKFHSIPLYLVWAEKCSFLRKAILINYSLKYLSFIIYLKLSSINRHCHRISV